MAETSKERAAPSGKSGRSAYGGPKIKKTKAAVPSREKQKPGKTLDLSLKATKEPLSALPPSFKDSAASDELRKLDLTGQAALFRNAGLGPLRFAGGTLTWLNLSGVDCSSSAASMTNGPSMDWLFLKMMQALIVLNLSKCNLSELPKELASVTTLKALVASHNSLTSPSLTHLAPLKDLNSLILSDNQLTSFPSSALAGLTSLKKLSLANNNISDDGLPDFSVLQESLEEVRLNGNSGIVEIPNFSSSIDAKRTSSISLLELSHTGVRDVKDLKRLSHLPKLINLGLRDTSIAQHPEYRAKVTEAVPNLRILDNVRFDPLYLARKERGKEIGTSAQGGRAGTSKEQRGKNPRAQDSGWQGRSADARSDNTDKGKKRGREQANDREASHPSRHDNASSGKKSTRVSSVQEDTSANGRGSAEENADEHEPKRKRMKKAKKTEIAPVIPAKPPKSVGGSLSASKSAADTVNGTQQSSTATTSADKGAEVDLVRLAKEKSSVVGVVEVRAQIKKTKERPKKGSRAQSDGVKGEKGGSTVAKPDVLALLEQEKAKSAFVGGWD